MNKFSTLPVLITFLLFTAIGLSNAAADPADGWGKTYRLNSLYKAEIKNKGGEKLGVIEDFVMDARSGRIAFVVFANPGMAGLGQKVKIVPFEFFSFNEAEKTFLLDVSKEDLTAKIEVKNLQGDELGQFDDLVIDSQGRIPFVILSHKEKPIMIPFSALSLDQTKSFFVLDASEEKLASAPVADENSVSKSQAEEIYRYYGQAPYWTVDETDQSSAPKIAPLPEF
jgi:sporulation protein YlmC with PRC-barrel domain